MTYQVLLAPEAVEDLGALKANLRAEVREAMETHLRHEPTKTSKSRIKRLMALPGRGEPVEPRPGTPFRPSTGSGRTVAALRGQSRPQYRLRVGEVRVFYDVAGDTVEVLAIVAKSEAESWLARFGSPE